ncbi:MAG: thermopsin, partial [Thermoplasmata archaeon]|nr:thermopsin [Thermoplasmata archaeon]
MRVGGRVGNAVSFAPGVAIVLVLLILWPAHPLTIPTVHTPRSPASGSVREEADSLSGGPRLGGLALPLASTGVMPSDRAEATVPSPMPVRPAAFQVNPYLAHSKEPAPMGIADFGVSGSGGGSSAYAYSTASFQASALVQSMHIAATSGSSTIKVAAFELNAVVVLQLNGTNYSYWIQNGLHVDTSTDEYTIGGAYVWNFSSPTARLSGSELKGNVSSVLLSDTYYFIPGCGGFPGQCSTLNLPANLT